MVKYIYRSLGHLLRGAVWKILSQLQSVGLLTSSTVMTHKSISLGASQETPPFGDSHMNFSCDDTEKKAMTQKPPQLRL